jgi:sodium/pantothenate symporter
MMNWGIVLPLIIFLFIIFIVGFWTNKHVRNSDSFLQEYFLGSRSMGGFILAMTMMATYGSASSFIGGPGIAYSTGLGWVLLAMAQLPAGYFVLTVLGKKFAIVSRQYRAITLIDFLKNRYHSEWIGILAAISIIIFLFSSIAAQWVGGARLLESLFPISYPIALTIFAFSVMIYVIIGGFRAVALTDTILGTIMFFGTLILLVAVINAGGGINNIMENLMAIDPGLVTPFGADGSLSASYVSSYWILVGIGVVGLPQIAVRAMSYKNSRSMHQAIIITTVFVGIIMLGMHLVGVFARAVHPNIAVADSVMPTITMEVLPPFFAGIVLAAPMAAIMSTVNALLIMVSSAVVKDIYLSYVNPQAQDQKVRSISYLVTAILGVIVYLMALSPPDFLIWLNLFSFGGLEAAFIWPVVLGLYWKKGNKYGAISSMIVGVTSYILFHQFYPNALGMHTVIFPILLSFLAFVAVSVITQKKELVHSI